MKLLYSFVFLFVFLACKKKEETLNDVAKKYVKLGLEIGQQDSDFVDAYYGPDSLKPKERNTISIDQFEQEVLSLKKNLDLNSTRSIYLNSQLTAYQERLKVIAGNYSSFDEESKNYFTVSAPSKDFADFDKKLKELDFILPGEGEVYDRFQNFSKKFIIPKEKVDTLFKVTINEARKRTKKHIKLPESESFEIEYVNNKPWSGYNWYLGNYKSKIQINMDFPISIERVIDVGSHESYPGHHVYNMLLEENLYNKKGYIETSIYPLFSPQSFLAEGSANYGIELAFPDNEKIEFCKSVLLPLANLDTAGISSYFKALDLIVELNYANNEIAKKYFSKEISDEEAISLLKKYALYSPEKAKQRLEFIKKYRSYVINYNYGKDLVKSYIEDGPSTTQSRWNKFHKLLSNQILPKELLPKEN